MLKTLCVRCEQFGLFLSGACHDSWVFYGLLFVAMVTYTDLFSMNKIFDKKPLI